MIAVAEAVVGVEVEVDVDELLRRLVSYRGGKALIAVSELGQALGTDQETGLDLASELEALGLLDAWLDDDMPVVLLSALSAERLDLILWPSDDDLANCYWIRRGSTPPRERRRPGPGLEADLFPSLASGTASAGLDGFPDETATQPLDGLVKAEQEARQPTGKPRGKGRDGLARRDPTVKHFHGSLTGIWMACPSDDHLAPCPFCAGASLRIDECCLWCDRAGAVERGVVALEVKPPSVKIAPAKRASAARARKLTKAQRRDLAIMGDMGSAPAIRKPAGPKRKPPRHVRWRKVR